SQATSYSHLQEGHGMRFVPAASGARSVQLGHTAYSPVNPRGGWAIQLARCWTTVHLAGGRFTNSSRAVATATGFLFTSRVACRSSTLRTRYQAPRRIWRLTFSHRRAYCGEAFGILLRQVR